MKYNVGDRVRIKSLDWYNENIKNNGIIICGSESFTHPMSHFCDKVVTIVTIQDVCYRILEDDGDWYWTDEMIEGLVEEENKPKFKVGDEVRIKGTDIGGTIESVIRGQLIVNSKGSKIPAWPEDVVLMKSVEEETKSENKLLDDYEELTDRAFKGGYEKCKSDIELNGFQLPEGYIFKDENGNEILTSKIILKKKKKEYPKTYTECSDILSVYTDPDIDGYKGDLLWTFQKLLICRDAYWKIAGEEMGLGKPWEPDWSDASCSKYIIDCFGGEICKGITAKQNTTFAFPTEEIRNAFKENFDKDLEICKELL